MASAMDHSRPARASAEGYRDFLALRRAPARHLRAATSSGSRSEDMLRHHRPQGQLSARRPCATCCAAHGQLGGRHDPRQRARTPRVAQMLDHFTQYVGSSPVRLAGGALRHRPHAGGRGRLVPARRHARRRRGAGASSPRAGRRSAHRRGGDAASTSSGGAVRGVRDRRRRASRLDAVVSNMDARPHLPRAGRRLPRPQAFDRKGYEPACSGVVLYLGLERALRAPAAPRLRLLPRPARGVRLHLQARASRPPTRPATSRPPPAPTRRRRRRAAKRSTCWSTRPTCGRTTTGSGCSRPTARSSSTSSKTTGGMPDIEERIVFERHLTPQDIHDRYKRAERRDLRAGQPRQVASARSSPATAAGDVQGPVPRRRRRPPRARHADGDDVRLDRGRRARPATPAASAAAEGLVSRRASRAASPVARRSPAAIAFMGALVRALLPPPHGRPPPRALGPAPTPRPARSSSTRNHPGWWDAVVYILLARPSAARLRRATRRSMPRCSRSTASSRASASSASIRKRRAAPPTSCAAAAASSPTATACSGSPPGPLRRRRASARSACAPASPASPSVTPDARFLPLAIEYASGPSAAPRRWPPSVPRCPPPTSSPCRDASAWPARGGAHRHHGPPRRRRHRPRPRPLHLAARGPSRASAASTTSGAARGPRSGASASTPPTWSGAGGDDGAGVVALLLAALPAILCPRQRRALRTPRPEACRPASVSILIPARDEAANIGDALAAARASRGVDRSRSWSWTTARPTARPTSSAPTPRRTRACVS